VLSIIIPVHNQIDVTKTCVKSVVDRTTIPYEIIIVNDQSSPDETQQFKELAQEYNCKYLETQHQAWHSGACNLGLRHAKGEFLCLLNSDTVVATNWAKYMVDFLETEEGQKCSCVGPSTSYASSHQQINHLFQARFKLSYAKIDHFAKAIYGRFGRAFVVTRLTGFCLIFSREVFEKIGFLDQVIFPSAGNEMDWQIRGLLLGLKPYWIRCSYVHHLGEVSYINIWDIAKKRDRWQKADQRLIDKHGKVLFEKIHKKYWLDQKIND